MCGNIFGIDWNGDGQLDKNDDLIQLAIMEEEELRQARQTGRYAADDDDDSDDGDD